MSRSPAASGAPRGARAPARGPTQPIRPTPGHRAVMSRSEAGRSGTLSCSERAAAVARVRAGLRVLGVTKGDRVAAYLPNVPEALIGLLGSASLGAIWSSCSPDCGAHNL